MIGRSLDSLHTPKEPLFATYHALLKPNRGVVLTKILFPLLRPNIIKVIPLPVTKRARRAREVGRTICAEFSKSKVASMTSKGTAGSVRDSNERLDILSLAMQSRYTSVEELTGHPMGFFIAGHETVASTADWAIYELARHPYIQDALRDEVRSKVILAAEPSRSLGVSISSRNLQRGVADSSSSGCFR
jgi:cytochrome P450